MTVEQIMTRPAVACGVREMLDTPARLMWEHDCGAIAVVDDGGKLAGMVTDRDICMATFTKGVAPQAIAVAEIMSRRITTCWSGDSVSTAEGLMRNHQIRRLPVVDGEQRLVGMLSLSDVARYAATTRRQQAVDRELVQTLAAIGEPRTSERAWARAGGRHSPGRQPGREQAARCAPAARAKEEGCRRRGVEDGRHVLLRADAVGVALSLACRPVEENSPPTTARPRNAARTAISSDRIIAQTLTLQLDRWRPRTEFAWRSVHTAIGQEGS